MASPGTSSNLNATNICKPGSTRRQIGSNIGVRRQHAIVRTAAVNGRHSFLQLHDGSGLQRLDSQPDESSSQYSRRQSHQSVQSRSQTLNRNESSTTDAGIAKSGESSSSNDSKSPFTIITNPDLELLPVEKTVHARSSFDFYVNSYVVSIIEVSPQNVNNYTHVVHQILHDELLFTAFTTCSEAARWRTQSLYSDPPITVAKGYGKTITLLSERLRSERFAMTPSVLLTMGQLVAIETMIKNVSATARHLAGMQSAMMAKHASSSPQGSAPVQKAVDIWTQFFIMRAVVKSKVNRNIVLTYPRHPFNPELSNRISELPLGFADVALSGRVSTEMLELLDRFNMYFTMINQFIKDGITDSPERTEIVLQQAAFCIEYTQIRALTLVERLLLAALTAYVVRRDRIHPSLVNMRNYFQITCAYSANLLNVTTLHQKDHGSNLLIWVGLTLLLTSTPEAYARKLALRLLPRRPEPLKLLKQCQEFFWDEDLTNALLSGSVLITTTSNDIIADNVKQALPESEGRGSDPQSNDAVQPT